MTDDELDPDDVDALDALALDPDWEHVDPLLAAMEGQVVEYEGIDRETGEVERGTITFLNAPGLNAGRHRQPDDD